MSVGLDIKITGNIETVSRKIRAIKVVDLEKIKPQSLELVKQQIRDNFSNQQEGDGAKLARLLPATEKDRARRGYGASEPILIRTGALEDAYTDGLKATVGRNFISFESGTADEKLQRIARYIQKGTDKMVARRFLSVSAKLSAGVSKVLADAQIQEIITAFQPD